MGTAASVERKTAVSTECLSKKSDLNSKKHFDVELMSGKEYVCCVKHGTKYRKTPNLADVNYYEREVAFNEVICPRKKVGSWFEITTNKWLPVSFFDERTATTEVCSVKSISDLNDLCVARDSPPQSPIANIRSLGNYSEKWEIVDNILKQVKIADVVDAVAMHCDKLLLIVRIQSAERGRQARKRRKARRKEKRMHDLDRRRKGRKKESISSRSPVAV